MKLSWVIEDFWRGIPVPGRSFVSGAFGALVGGLVGSLLGDVASLVGAVLGGLAVIVVVVRDGVRNG